MPQSSGASTSRRSGSCKTRRYRTLAPSSQIDESLFGGPKRQSPPDNLKSEPRGGRGPPSREQARSAPVQRTKRPQTLRIITKDLIRELKIPSEDPSGTSIILPPIEVSRLTTSSRVLSKQQREAVEESLQQRKEALLDAVEERKAQMHQANMSRRKNQALNDLEEEARDRAQYLLEKANAMRMEQEDEVKRLNELILGARCHAVREGQILERKQIKAELVEEERHLDALMEQGRLRAIETQEQIDMLRKEQRIRGKQQIIHQMEERRDEELLRGELKEQEAQQLLEVLEKLQLEDLEALEKKRQQQSLLQDEIERINRETIQAKEQKKEQEKLADLKAMEYTKQKMEREAEHEEKQMLLKKGKEKEVARLRALQERDRDHKADQDELRARRNREATEREWRRKTKELAERKVVEDAKLKRARLEQVGHKERLLSVEAGRERAEFERVLRAQQAAIAKQEAEEQGHRQKALQHADGVRQQVRERELQAVARRREVYKEREELDEAGRQRRLRLDEIKERKLRELKAAGIPEKYCNQVERKLHALPPLAQ
ncbi:cilia- and flagella-associated protein 45 [Gadus morhua]|uniref:Cilia- and flagella-associated protein 45 n=1 Tax=Gadus morhua TaxID=8049 RepID=A0A8C5D2D2_GADMO|nr:cilia- and flagella-associated protein 45 [Gadus morhua]